MICTVVFVVLLSAAIGVMWDPVAERLAAARDEQYVQERLDAARELRRIVDLARQYHLPLYVEPTRMVHGVVVYPFNCRPDFDENGVPR